MNKLHEKIRSIIKRSSHLNQKGLARHMSLNPSAISRMLHGMRKILAEEVHLIEQYLGVELQYIDANSCKKDKEISGAVPVYSHSKRKVDLQSRDIVDWFPIPPKHENTPGIFAIYMNSENMAPRYFRGEIVYAYPDQLIKLGHDCIVEKKDGGLIVCRLVKLGKKKITVAHYKPSKKFHISNADIKRIYAVIGRG